MKREAFSRQTGEGFFVCAGFIFGVVALLWRNRWDSPSRYRSLPALRRSPDQSIRFVGSCRYLERQKTNDLIE